MRFWLAPLLCLFLTAAVNAQVRFDRAEDRLKITTLRHQPIVEYVFSDAEIRRPYFTRAHSPEGQLLTRQHPPVSGIDATDHATMHPGIWLALGDVNGQDFWRNKATIKHRAFTMEPTIQDEQLRFDTECELISDQSAVIGRLQNRYVVTSQAKAWLILWQATFEAVDQELVFGDQEEMGFGTRLATGLTEKRGGKIINSNQEQGAANTWGQAAQWCDYSGQFDGHACGITLIASPKNFRISRWHNRDYGLMVANPFAIAAMKQGEPSKTVVQPGKPLTITFAALLHDYDYQPEKAYTELIASELLTN